MQFDNQKTRNIADVAAKILAGKSEKQEPKMLEEELKGDQHKIDANKNNKIDAHDFKLLRAKKKVEEEVEELDEIKMADLPATKVQGRAYGASKPEPHILDTLKGPKEKELKAIEAEKKKKKFSEMVNMYQDIGLKSLSQLMVNEEPTQDEFEKEIKTAQDKSEGKIRNDKNIAAGKVDAVKEVEESVDDINGVQIETIEEEVELVEGILSKVAGKLANATGITPQDVANSTIREFNKKAPGTKMHGHPNFSKFKSDVHAHVSSAKNADEAIKRSSDNHVMSLAKKHFTEEIDTIEEKTLTEPEMKKKEEIVKGMKKGMAGFKQRYGERAKEVMYATATARAKGE